MKFDEFLSLHHVCQRLLTDLQDSIADCNSSELNIGMESSYLVAIYHVSLVIWSILKLCQVDDFYGKI
jgi:hypothetical protein